MKYYIFLITLLFLDFSNCFIRNSFKFRSNKIHSDFSYGENDDELGPINWSKMFPRCDGPNQSPINIDFTNLNKATNNRLYIDNYCEVPQQITLANNGHTATFEFKWGNKIPTIKGGPITEDDSYIFGDLHVHWGHGARNGSEHTINSKRFDTEFHLVFYNKKYGGLSTAKTKVDGLVVLGIFGQLSDHSSSQQTFDKYNSVFRNIIDPFTAEVLPKTLSLCDIFGLNILKKYYTYNGSLTTPPCYESVTWIVSSNPIKITRSQLISLQSLKSAHGVTYSNLRPIQNLNDRTIFVVLNNEY